MDGIVVMGITITVTIGTAIILMGIGTVDLSGEEENQNYDGGDKPRDYRPARD
jgi:hypothetical protein